MTTKTRRSVVSIALSAMLALSIASPAAARTITVKLHKPAKTPQSTQLVTENNPATEKKDTQAQRHVKSADTMAVYYAAPAEKNEGGGNRQ